MADPNLDLGLDYTGGITKPTPDEVGFFARVDSSGRNLEYVAVTPGALLVAPSPWVEAMAQDHRNTNATTANQVIGGFGTIPGLVGVDCMGRGDLTVTLFDIDESTPLETQVLGFTFKVVGGSTIVSSSALVYGVTTHGAASVVASGAGFNVRVTPSLGSLWRWDCLVKILGRPT